MSDANNLLRRFLLALAIWREARGESFYGKVLVGWVIKNRVNDTRWADTYVGVITERRQFSAFNIDDPQVALFPNEESQSWADCVAAADAVLETVTPVTTANHYHTRNVNPKWADKTRIVMIEGNHVFYQL